MSLTTTPHKVCRCPWRITRVLRWLTPKPSSIAIAPTRATKKRAFPRTSCRPKKTDHRRSGSSWHQNPRPTPRPTVEPPRRQIGDGRRGRRPLRKMGVAQAAFAKNLWPRSAVARGARSRSARVSARCKPRQYHGHTSWVANAPEEGDHARDADAGEDFSRSMRTTTLRPTCGATNVRTLRPGTKPWATSDTGIPGSTSSSSQRWIRLRRGLGASSSLQPPPVAGDPPVMVVAELRLGTTCIHPPLVREPRELPVAESEVQQPSRQAMTSKECESPAGGPLTSNIVAVGISQRRARDRMGRPNQVAPRRPRSPTNVRASSSSRSTGAMGKATSIRRTSCSNHRVRPRGPYPSAARPRVTSSPSVHVPARNANANPFAR